MKSKGEKRSKYRVGQVVYWVDGYEYIRLIRRNYTMPNFWHIATTDGEDVATESEFRPLTAREKGKA